MAAKRKTLLSDQELYELTLSHHGNCAQAARDLGISRSGLHGRLRRAGLLAHLRSGKAASPVPVVAPVVSGKEKLNVQDKGAVTEIDYLGEQITNYEELIAKSGVDLALFEVERVITNVWEQAGSQTNGRLYKTGLRQIKVILRRKRDETIAIERVLERLSEHGPIRSKICYPKDKTAKSRRALEVSLMDPHLGMLCFKGESDHAWDLDQCARLCLWSVDRLVRQAAPFGGFDEIVFPFGNDFMHHDNLLHTTTKGTLQPEGVAYFQVYERAIELALAMVDRLSQVAPVRVIQISGNHDQVSAFSLGHVLRAHYRRDENVTIEVGQSPYKFWRYGVNLVGFDHGHHVKPIRLAALMAHEAKDHWAQTCFREWHLGDQHRKGSGSPVVMEEQGVSIEYLPSLTPPNAWHRLKSFNWQQRGAMAFVWDHDEGPLARLQVNINSYTGKPLGS
jgi:hypothetical protein